ncbi:MAG TPA: alpha/beta hydrolase domain-containing protein [Acetobacteraceae bacterium]|nr:alpha/beta hydrolase domain-containing protein [Acetobacteraceae bacterium]
MTSQPGSVLQLEITERLSPAFDGRSFGSVGTYECLTGTIHGELDPSHPLNATIVNLDKAPRNTAGRVAYRSEFTLMTPSNLAKGNGWLLYDVPNRGNKVALTRLNRGAEGNRPISAAHAGDGLLMRHGFSIIWSAWQSRVPAGADRLGAQFPTVPATTINRDEFIAEGFGPGDAFIQEISETAFIGTLSYQAADLAPDKSSLTVRQRQSDPRATPRGLTWRYIDAHHIEILRPPGFDRGAIYEFIYPAKDPEVMGIGFAAIRDLVSFLRYDCDARNPIRGNVRHTVGFGISQSGRVLRDLVHLGFNQDLSGRQVFDAIFPIVSGSRRTFINFAFAQPGRYSRQHEDHAFLDDQFPFTYPTLTDPLSGKTDGIMRRAAEAGVRPKVMHLDADSDMWAARASLVVTDPAGQDVAMPDDVRVYLASSTQHAVHRPAAKHAGQLAGNPLGYGAWMRALLIALTEWVEQGTPPPVSRFPSRAERTLVTREEAERAFPRIPGVKFPDVLNELHLRDHSVQPPTDGPAYPVFVNALDEDGNSLGGLRHPLLAAPRGTHTGWAIRGPGYAEGDLFTVQGSFVPFAATEAERMRAGDPRRSIEERYGSHGAWAARVTAAAEQLVAERLLLREDADRLIAAARESGDVMDVL